MSAAIFDRTEIVQLLKDTCLAEEGSSSAIICSQKIGKSYLLRHVYETHGAAFTAGQRVIFCALNMDLLQSIIQSRGDHPDQAFLFFFCQRLQDQLETWVEDFARGEADRKAEMQDLAQRAASATGTLKTALDLKKESLRLQQVELDRLRTILTMLDPLVTGSKPIDIPTVAKVLDKLKRGQKRVILFIDDFDRMLKKNDVGLSNAVFNFLRGASTEKKLVTLVASTLHPMDPELHDTNERPSLVNHLQVQPVAPFTTQQATEFLVSWLSKPWLAQGRSPLNAEQIAYLLELGGGSPYFLVTIYRIYEMQSRPPAATRAEFENGAVIPLLEPAFREVWRRCSAERRAMLREVADGKPILTTGRTALDLEREGYLIIKGVDAQLFSRLFANFVKSAPDEPLPRPEVTAVLKYKVFPTALALAQPAEIHPLISFTLTNPTGNDVGISLECELMKYGNRIPHFTPLRRRTSTSVDLRFTLQNLPISFDASWGDFAYSAWLELSNGAKTPLANTVEQMRILPIDTFVFARRDKASPNLIDWSWMIAAWVSKNQAVLHPIIQKARELNGGETRGYAVSGDVPAAVRAQAEALYEALRQNTKITYDDSATVFHLEGNDYAQRVRLPYRSLRDESANCLDGSVLFASLLATIGLHPIILLLPRHAIVGWKQEDSETSDTDFLETTSLAKKKFAEANQEGKVRYAAVKTLADAWRYTGEIPDVKEFAIPIDVEKEWTLRHVVSLPWP
jgi:hypothetical protein